jgi:hypothetical protein
MAVAVAGFLAAATACSSSSRAVEPDLTPTPNGHAIPFTAQSLITALHDRGMAFEFSNNRNPGPFNRMNGYVSIAGLTGEFAWGDETLEVYEFTGPGEALVAATRIDEFGGGYMMPTRDRTWVGGDGGYGMTGPRYAFVEGQVIARYIGDSEEVPAALEELMGKPFAGSPYWDGGFTPEERIPQFAEMWQEIVPEMEFVSAERLFEGSQSSTYRIRYRAYLVHSFACSGETEYGSEVVSDEVHITLVQSVVDTGVVEMSEPCDMDWQWDETSAIVQRLTLGENYDVFFNGKQVGSFVAG